MFIKRFHQTEWRRVCNVNNDELVFCQCLFTWNSEKKNSSEIHTLLLPGCGWQRKSSKKMAIPYCAQLNLLAKEKALAGEHASWIVRSFVKNVICSLNASLKWVTYIWLQAQESLLTSEHCEWDGGTMDKQNSHPHQWAFDRDFWPANSVSLSMHRSSFCGICCTCVSKAALHDCTKWHLQMHLGILRKQRSTAFETTQ